MSLVRAFAPGRTELAGNHTDHQGGRVMAATVSCGIEIQLQANNLGRARLQSDGFAPVDIDVNDGAPCEAERNTTAALVRGIVAGLRGRGIAVQGFDARATSTVPAGGGLSSSAAFELALACGLRTLFECDTRSDLVSHAQNAARDRILCHAGEGEAAGAVDLARIGQHAESAYFGKPCGLMDQAAIACGGINLFDFACEPPAIDRIDFDFAQCGHAICLIDTHCDHSRYTGEYAQVARDMGDVARFLGASALSQVPREVFFDRFEDVRAKLGDMPALRGLHYYHEMRLVDDRAKALKNGDFGAFLAATRQSGASSAQYLQNVSTSDRAEQPAMVALALADALLEGQGAVRIHGGGFGGTVQAFVPQDRLESFTRAIDAHLGAGSCQVYTVVQQGAHAQWA